MRGGKFGRAILPLASSWVQVVPCLSSFMRKPSGGMVPRAGRFVTSESGLTWYRASILLRPSPAEVRAMLDDLSEEFDGYKGIASMLGIGRLTSRSWLEGRRYPPAPSVRAIWLTWLLCLHPEILQTRFDLVTWGRFRNVSIIQAGHPKGQRTGRAAVSRAA